MSEHFQSLVEFYVLRISAMEAALKAAESERDALLEQLMERKASWRYVTERNTGALCPTRNNQWNNERSVYEDSYG